MIPIIYGSILLISLKNLNFLSYGMVILLFGSVTNIFWMT